MSSTPDSCAHTLLYLKLTWTVIYYCRRQPYFFLSKLYLEHSIGLVYIMVYFICKGLTRAVKNANRARITKWKSISNCGIRTQDLPLTKRTLYRWVTRADICRVNKISPGFTCAIFKKLPVASGRCSKIICRLFLSFL